MMRISSIARAAENSAGEISADFGEGGRIAMAAKPIANRMENRKGPQLRMISLPLNQ